jgi:hypothetical protein
VRVYSFRPRAVFVPVRSCRVLAEARQRRPGASCRPCDARPGCRRRSVGRESFVLRLNGRSKSGVPSPPCPPGTSSSSTKALAPRKPGAGVSTAPRAGSSPSQARAMPTKPSASKPSIAFPKTRIGLTSGTTALRRNLARVSPIVPPIPPSPKGQRRSGSPILFLAPERLPDLLPVFVKEVGRDPPDDNAHDERDD